ncbi:MAG: hypothetical protein HY863_17785 [Chloroflexi bacterium]|nr:hypothetical protein [Chloroflexota bacterium]
MADVIKCPVCGESNLPDQEFCQYCRSRLEPLTGSLKGEDAPIKPGQAPTKKTTAELEPILPQWLRDARDSARKSTEKDSASDDKSRQESFSASSFDLLAGLQSQKAGDEEDNETPEWLTNITGATPKPKKDQPESSEVRWVELGGVNDFAPEETAEAKPAEPSWLKDVTPTNENSDLNDWFREASGSQTPQQPEQPTIPDDSFSAPAAPSDTPDWLRQMAADSEAQNASAAQLSSGGESVPLDTPDWLRSFAEENEPRNKAVKDASDASPASSFGEEPDWLRALGASQDQTQSAGTAAFSEAGPGTFDAAAGSSADNLPDWMQNLPPVEKEKPKQGTVPRWLQEEKPVSSAETDMPVWLSDLPASEPVAPEPEQPAADENLSFGDIPNWLKAAAPQSSIYSEPTEEQASEPSSDTPDWLSASSDASQPQSTPAFSLDEIVDAPPPAFTPDAQASYNMDALFTDMPDWLSNATENPSASNLTPAATSAESITPGELPSWVQAMRPVDSGSPLASLAGSDQAPESRGALAGLQGVLPAAPGYAATNRPKAYSIKLLANEEQQTHAAMLEQIVAAETAPVPIGSFSTLQTSRILRWVITFVLFVILVPVLFMGTQSFSLPVGAPPAIDGAIEVLQSIPEGAPVLVAFDYEPARSAEMEAAAAPIFNRLSKPNLIFISTNETGGILAERFISGPLAGLSGDGGLQSLNLGYLPGGQMGIRAFAQNPSTTAPFDVALADAWTTPQLQGITSLSKFAALIIVTDNANSARAWIEQTSTTRGTIPLLVISSAQAAPMIQPYYDSQQVNGLVAGLYGGAVVEQKNGGASDGTARRYWDAYSIGMLLAMALVLGGGLLNLALGLRDRVAAGEAK